MAVRPQIAVAIILADLNLAVAKVDHQATKYSGYMVDLYVRCYNDPLKVVGTCTLAFAWDTTVNFKCQESYPSREDM